MRHITYTYLLYVSCLALFFVGCQSTSDSTSSVPVDRNAPMFKQLSANQTGIQFENKVVENADFNHILQDVIFNGGGVAIIDINKDGLQDLFFTGNMESDRLYLNQGGLKFKDITKEAGLENDSWSTAVAVADVNNDGWQDIYVGKYMLQPEDKRRNHLYINNGDMTFTEKAADFGINDSGFCTAVNFFDYNKDGWLDLYVGNQPHIDRHIKTLPVKEKHPEKHSDHLYKNNGDGTFSKVTKETGITNYNYTLSATVSDLDNDGWQDIYVASDYEEPDMLYKNNGDGTFTNTSYSALRHMSTFSMGVDMADFNNDGWLDIYVADMAASSNYRQKANMSGMNPEKFWNLAKSGFHYQYMFNVLQLNNGNGTFSDVAQLTGVSNTDWSWSTLFADYDNDGDKDLYVTNGLVKDVNNKDYTIRRSFILDSLASIARAKGEKPNVNSMELAKLAPSNKLVNHFFENKRPLEFEDQTTKWGFSEPSWSNGAAYADLDNDGDLEIVVSNVNDKAFVYQNTSMELKKAGNYLRFQLEDKSIAGNNKRALGGRIWVYVDGVMQLQEFAQTRGYFSSVEPFLHFGIGNAAKADRVVFQWPNGKLEEIKSVKANQTLTLTPGSGQAVNMADFVNDPPVFKPTNNNANIDFIHKENKYDDFKEEVLLPYRMSHLGPCLAKMDVDKDGLEDFYIGGAAGQAGALYKQLASGQFEKSSSQPWTKDKGSEDVNAMFFDADGDGDSDLYISSGGSEFKAGHKKYQDRIYLNDGKGNFQKAAQALPKMHISTGVAAAADYDGDGDADLFVGARQTPGQYGVVAKSYLLVNNNGKFSIDKQPLSEELESLGMVTDALWFDYDQDNDLDLVTTGEWMPITIFENNNGKFNNVTSEANLSNTTGWWNKLSLADTDNDGDQDLIAGNLGTNIKYKATEDKPFNVYVKDFDGNGTHDIYLGYYDTDGVCYPVRGRQCSSQQMPFIKKKFASYDKFAQASIKEVLGTKAEGSVYHEAKTFHTSIFINNGNKGFEQQLLPNEAQISPTYGIATRDFNEDGHMDILLVGNYYEREVETTRSDAGSGCLLVGDGKGKYTPLKPNESGIAAILDARALLVLQNKNKEASLLIANNNAGVQIYEKTGRLPQ